MHRNLRLLHRRGKVLHDTALCRVAVVLDNLHALLRDGQRADVLLDQRTQRLEVHVAHDREEEAVGIGVELAVDARQGLEAELVEVLERDHLTARVVAVGLVGEDLHHRVVGVRLGILQLRAEHVHQRVVVVLVEARLREVEPQQLEHRLEVLGRADAVHDAGVVLDRGLYRCRLARELLLELRGGEFADTRHRVDGRHHLTHVELPVREDRETALGQRTQAHLVGLVGRGLHNHLHAVLERPLRRAERGVLDRLLHGRALQLGALRDERLLDHVVLVGLDLR